MSARKASDAEVQRIVYHYSYVTRHAALVQVTKDWSSTDFLSAIELLASSPPPGDVAATRDFLHRLREERASEQAQSRAEEISASQRVADNSANERRHREAMEAARQSAAKSDHANHIAKWAIVIALAALIVSVIQTFWH